MLIRIFMGHFYPITHPNPSCKDSNINHFNLYLSILTILTILTIQNVDTLATRADCTQTRSDSFLCIIHDSSGIWPNNPFRWAMHRGICVIPSEK